MANLHLDRIKKEYHLQFHSIFLR